MKKTKRTIRTRRGLNQYTYLGCPLTRNRSPWCFRLCVPDEGGAGDCGRPAPHGMKSRIQLGIEGHKRKRLLDAHFGKLENMYLDAPCNEGYEPGTRISEAAAEIVVPVNESMFDASGFVSGPVYAKAMDDAARLAVNSLIDTALVVTVSFNMVFTRAIRDGEIIARGRFMGASGDHYVADAVLTDRDGNEIGRGQGAYMRSTIALSPEIGYE